MSIFADKTLLITGGTGSFGNAVLNRFLRTDIGEIRIFSRDEKKQDDNKSSLYLLIFLIIINIISYSYYLFKILKINIKRIIKFKKKKDNISI